MVSGCCDKALILLSGGMDSAAALWWSKKNNYEISTLSFQFPGRRSGEIRAVEALRQAVGCQENFDLNIPFLDPPEADLGCYIPQRNLMYYGIAASLAEKINAGTLIGGHFLADGNTFPDATQTYFNQLQSLLNLGWKRGPRLRLVFPFITSNKEDIVRHGQNLGVPFHLTWSCSRHGLTHCWKCGSCRERVEGFIRSGVSDPLFDQSQVSI